MARTKTSIITQESVVLNDFGLTRRSRTTTNIATGQSRTKDRMTVQISSEPILHNFDAMELGKGPAEAIRDHLSKAIRNIGEMASPSTRIKRTQAKRKFQEGDAATMRRYAGGRIGALEPDQTERLFNDSGRLSRLTVMPNRSATNEKSPSVWEVNVPANRFDPNTFGGGDAALMRMIDRLQALIPELGDPKKLAQVREVREAIADSITEKLMLTREKNAELMRALRDARISLASDIVGGLLRLTLP